MNNVLDSNVNIDYFLLFEIMWFILQFLGLSRYQPFQFLVEL
jgi:hypothetical protein